MSEELLNFLEELTKDESVSEETKNKAKKIIEEDFKNQVLAIFKYCIQDNLTSKCKFVNSFVWCEEAATFMENHWNKIGMIIDILKESLSEE